MIARRLVPGSLILMASLGCTSAAPTATDKAAPPITAKADKPPTPQTPTAMPDPETAAANKPRVCCGSRDDIKRLDGSRVRLRGVYERTGVSKRHAKRGDPTPPPNLDEPGTVVIKTESSGVMLGIYYDADGMRTAAEGKRFHGQRVEVVGVVHLATPTQYYEGVPMQTMINPYIGAIESIELFDSQ